MDNKLDKTEFEIAIIKKINREDVMELIGNLSGGGDLLAKLQRDVAELHKKIMALT